MIVEVHSNNLSTPFYKIEWAIKLNPAPTVSFSVGRNDSGQMLFSLVHEASLSSKDYQVYPRDEHENIGVRVVYATEDIRLRTLGPVRFIISNHYHVHAFFAGRSRHCLISRPEWVKRS